MKRRKVIEQTAKIIFTICAAIAILAVASITFYLVAKGIPAAREVGIGQLLFTTSWRPTASEPSYGIFFIILSSLVSTFASILIGVPIGLCTAVFLSEIADRVTRSVVSSAV